MRIQRTVSLVLCCVLTAGLVVLAPPAPPAQGAAPVSDWYWQNPLPSGESLTGVDFISASTGYAVGPLGTIMKTANGGAYWRKLDSLTTVRLLDVCFSDADHGWAVGDLNTILSTEDGGETWTPQAAPGTSVTLNCVEMVSSDIGWIVGASGRILATIDGGANWVSQTGPDTTTVLQGVSFADASHGWAVGYSGKIWVTANGGNTWTPQTGGPGVDYLSVDFSSASRGMAVGNGGRVSRTVNGGTTWTTSTLAVSGNSNSLMLNDICFVDASHAWVVGDLWGLGFVLASGDGGASWSLDAPFRGAAPLSVLEAGSDIDALDMIDAFTGRAVGASGSVWSTTDGATWAQPRDAVTHLPLYEIQFRGASRGYAVGAGGVALNTIDGGSTWSAHSIDATKNFYGSHFPDDTHGWAVGEAGAIYATVDGGDTWTAQLSGTSNTLRSVWFRSNSTGWAVGNGGTILKTINGGDTWAPQVSGVSLTLRDVQFATDSIGWAVGAPADEETPGTILMTTDGGATWGPQTSDLDGTLFSVHVYDSAKAWVCGNRGVQYTADGGTTWTTQMATSQAINGVAFADQNTGWLVGDHGVVYKTSDGGVNWYPDVLTTTGLNAISATGPTGAWACGSGGAIIATHDASPLIGTFVLNDGAAYVTESIDILNDGLVVLNSNVALATGMRYRRSDNGGAYGEWQTPSVPGYHPWFDIGMPSNAYTFQVEYTDGVHAPLILEDSITVDTIAPTAPAVTAAALTTSSVKLTWSGATDETSGIGSYRVYLGDLLVATLSATAGEYTVTGLAAGTTYTFAVKAVDAAGNPSAAGADAATTLALVPVYRFFNLGTGTHLYTASEAEKNHILATWPTTMRLDGFAYYYDPLTDTATLHRLFNLRTGTHFYTASTTELNYVLATWPTIFRYEGPAYPVSIAPSGTKTTVYRFFNLQTNTHFYTGSAAEADHVIATWPTIMRYEGPAFYVGQ